MQDENTPVALIPELPGEVWAKIIAYASHPVLTMNNLKWISNSLTLVSRDFKNKAEAAVNCEPTEFANWIVSTNFHKDIALISFFLQRTPTYKKLEKKANSNEISTIENAALNHVKLVCCSLEHWMQKCMIITENEYAP